MDSRDQGVVLGGGVEHLQCSNKTPGILRVGALFFDLQEFAKVLAGNAAPFSETSLLGPDDECIAFGSLAQCFLLFAFLSPARRIPVRKSSARVDLFPRARSLGAALNRRRPSLAP